MSQAGFEPTIPASERPQTHTLDRAASGILRRLLHAYQSVYRFDWESKVLRTNTVVTISTVQIKRH
jgi:hypothetical protein